MHTRLRFLSAALVLQVLLPGAVALAQHPASPFFGDWSLDLPDGAGWLSVHGDAGYLDAELLWYGGSVLPVAHVFVHDGVLRVTRISPYVRERNDDGEPVRTHRVADLFEFRLEPDGDALTGTAYLPDRNGVGLRTTSIRGTRIPRHPPAPNLSEAVYGDPVELFNGKDLTGWSLVDPEEENGFHVEDGVLVNDPVQPVNGPHVSYGNLRTDATFGDFNLKLQVNMPAGSNSGVYLRGRYEIQVLDSYGRPPDSHHMGALYSRIAPSTSAERPAGEWQDLDVTLYDRHLTVSLNGTTIIDNEPVPGVTGGALDADEAAPGPIYLQGDHGKVMYRNIVLIPILE